MGELTGRLRNVDSKLRALRNVESRFMTHLFAEKTVVPHGLPAHYVCAMLFVLAE